MFTESVYSSRLTEKQVLSMRILDLNKGLAEVPRSQSPLICVGQWISAASTRAGKINIEAIFVTPVGHVVVILSKKPSSTVVDAIIDELQSWTYNTLDRVAMDYSYREFGQAFSVCDLLARHGHITFSQESSLRANVTNCLQSCAFSLFCFEDPTG